ATTPRTCSPCCDERVESLVGRHGNKERDRPAAVCYLERLTGGNASAPAAGVLAKLTNPKLFHVLLGSTRPWVPQVVLSGLRSAGRARSAQGQHRRRRQQRRARRADAPPQAGQVVGDPERVVQREAHPAGGGQIGRA